MKFRQVISFLFLTWFLILWISGFAQLESIFDIDIPCHKVLQIDGDKAIGVHFAEDKYLDIVVFDIHSGNQIETEEGVVYTYVEYDDVLYFYLRHPSNFAKTKVITYASGELTQLSTYNEPCYNMWVMPELNGVVGASPSGIVLFTDGGVMAELDLGEPALNVLAQQGGVRAISAHKVTSVGADFNFITSHIFPSEWKSFGGAYLNGDFLLTDSIPFGYPDRSLAAYREDIGSLTPVTNANGEEVILPSYLLPIGEIDGQFLLAGNGSVNTEYNRLINPTGSGLINPISGVFTDFSNQLKIRTNRLQPILKQTKNGPLLFGRMGYEGVEPYRVTSDGLDVLKDIYPGFGNGMNYFPVLNAGFYMPYQYSKPFDIFSRNGILYFSARSPGIGLQIWRSDGTEAGTVAITNVSPETKGFKHAFFSEKGDDIMVSIVYSDDKVRLYKLDETVSAIVETFPNDQNWEVTYTKSTVNVGVFESVNFNHPDAMLADDGTIAFMFQTLSPETDYFSLNHKWVSQSEHFSEFYLNTAIQFMQSDGSLYGSALLRVFAFERRIVGRRSSDGHVFVVVSHSPSQNANTSVLVNNTGLKDYREGHFLIELDNFGNYVNSTFLPTGGKVVMHISQIKIDPEGIYILGQANPGFSMNGAPEISVENRNVRTLLFKYDLDLEPVWIKALQSDQPLFGWGLGKMYLDDSHVYFSSGGAGYVVRSTCGSKNSVYKIACLNKTDGNIAWEQTCVSDAAMRITAIHSLDNGQVWLGGYTRGNMSVGEQSLPIQENYMNCGYNGFMMCLNKSTGSTLYMRHSDPSRLKFIQAIDYKDQLIHTLSMVYEEDYFPTPIFGFNGHWSLQLDRINTSGMLVDSIRWPTAIRNRGLGEGLADHKFSMNLHPAGGVIIAGENMWNGSIDGFTSLPVKSVGTKRWLIQRRSDLNFLKAAASVDSGSDEVKVYPNPVAGYSIGLSISSSQIGKYQKVLIYNSEGRLVISQRFNSEFSDHIIELNSKMANGIYLLKLEGTGGDETVKFMVLR